MEKRRAVVFPGQGTSGGDFSGVVRDAVERAVGNAVGSGEVPYQLSVFARSLELLGQLREEGYGPDVVAGHSLGEYAAAYAAGSLMLEDGVRLVAERDRLMGEASAANPGGMMALIGADPIEVQQLAEAEGGVVVAANFNTPRQTVISGSEPAVDSVAEKAGGKKVALNVSGAFHSPLMVDAAGGMDLMLAETDFGDPDIPMVSATDGSVLSTAEDVQEALRKQMLSPVRWVAVMNRFADLGVEEILEAGDDGTLVRMLRDFRELDIGGKKAAGVLA